jgi:ADP-ribose pyrophosphatase YjhB (NUDIX family)
VIDLLDLSSHFMTILSTVGSARQGLTKPVFLFVSQLTPMINVDLLIRNETGQTLLTWREDEFYGPGWHIPGGVIRFKELAATRIQQVAQAELGVSVQSEKIPLCVNEMMAPNRDVRGHFISMLYRCALTSPLNMTQATKVDQPPRNGDWQWHDTCPHNIIPQHEMYRDYM